MASKRRKVSGAEREAERRAKTVGTSFAAVQLQLARDSRERAEDARVSRQDVAGARYVEWKERRAGRDVARQAARDALVALRRTAGHRAELDVEMVELVGAARSAGATWSAIAAASGLSRDGAVSRWGRRRGKAS